jgi:multidrug efflux pump subunit AcrA (membrane-fusion protein)
MSFPEPAAKTDPIPANPASGFTPPGHSTTSPGLGKGGNTRTLPTRGRAKGRFVWFAALGAFLLAASAASGWWFFLRPAPVRADVLLHTVKREPLIVTVAEKGTLESADNRDIVCKVRAGTKGFASTINWVIDDGTRVKPGQVLMILDDSALRDQEDNQQIVVENALANKVKAEKDVLIAKTQNKQNIATAESDLTNAINALKDYTGLTYDVTRAPFAALGGGPLALSEAGTFRQKLDDLTGQVRLAESDVGQNRERADWADRMVKLSYMSSAQAAAERARLDSSLEKLRSLQAQRVQLITSDRDQTLTKLVLARDIAQLAVERANLEAEANLAKFIAEERKCILLLDKANDTLNDIVQQRAECRIIAPENIEPDSMVVYYKPESNRFTNTTQGMIEQGAQVKEGQKMLRIPNLHRMQVNTKVHEAMVARIRGDVRVPTHVMESAQTAMMFNTDPFLRALGQRQDYVDRVRDKLRALGVKEYKTTSEGQKAIIRVDALPERLFEGHVRTVAAVASQADSWISDVKLYQTLVMIDGEVLPGGEKKKITSEELKPDMTAEVTITVDTATAPVLTVPVQAIIGGTEMGAKREVFVKTPTGYERKPITLGLYNEKSVEIREGLNEGDEIVLNPKVLLAPDDKTRTRDDGGKNGTKSGKGDKTDGAEGGGPKGEGGGPGGPGGNKGGKGKKGGGPGGPGGGGAPPAPQG